MFLRALLSAVASGRLAGKRAQALDPIDSLRTERITPNYGVLTNAAAQRLLGVFDDEGQYNDEHRRAFDEFLRLSPSEQLARIDEELATLDAVAFKQAAALLSRWLDRPFIPIPGPQLEAYQSPADIVFLGGGAGGGKTGLLCGLAVQEHRKSRLFRRESIQTRGLIDEVAKLLKTRDGLNGQDKVWRLPEDRVIEFAHCQYEDDKEKYQGQAADLLGFDEICHFTESQFRYLIGWNRTNNPQQRCRVVATGNPPERAEGRWVLNFWGPWLDPDHPRPAKPGELRWFTTVDGADQEVDGPGPHGKDKFGNLIYARSRTFFRSTVKNNIYLMDTGYIATLQAHPEPLRTMLLEGVFDVEGEDDPWQVIPTAWIRAAQERWVDHPPAGAAMTCIGVDVGLSVDDTVLAPRYGRWFAPLKVMKGIDVKDGATVAGLVFGAMRDGCEVAVDVGGGWGAGAHGHLKEQRIKSHAVNWVEGSTGKTREGVLGFLNQRAEMWWKFREALDPNNQDPVSLPPDKSLAADLATPQWKRTTGEGLIQIESKIEIRKRLGRSPDRGDAVVMSWGFGSEGMRTRERLAERPSSAVVGYAAHKHHGRAASGSGRSGSYKRNFTLRTS